MRIPFLNLEISSGNSFDEINKRLVTLEESRFNARPSMEYSLMFGANEVKLPRPTLPYWMIYRLADESADLSTIVRALTNEIFRNGWKFKPKYDARCPHCQAEFKFKPKRKDCPECGQEVEEFEEPDNSEIKELEHDFRQSVNLNGQTLIDLMKMLNRDLEIADDMYLMFVSSYTLNGQGKIIGRKVREMIRVPPENVAVLADDTGTLGRGPSGEKFFVDPSDRFQLIKVFPNDWDRIQSEKTDYGTRDYVTTGSGRVAYPAHYRVASPAAKLQDQSSRYGHMYYMEDEIVHQSKYRKTLLYGWPRPLVLYSKIVALMHMDRYVKEWFLRGRAKGIVTISTSNVPSLKEAWKEKKERLDNDPFDNSPLAVENTTGARGQVANWVKTTETPSELGMIDLRNSLRREIGAEYGVMPIFQADLSQSGGLNNEGLQVTVTNRAAADGQSLYNDNVFPKILEAFGVRNWKLELEPSEERDEMAELQRMQVKAGIASQMLGMGFDVRLADDGENFEYSGEAEKPQAPEDPFGFGGPKPLKPPKGAAPAGVKRPPVGPQTTDSKPGGTPTAKADSPVTSSDEGVHNPVARPRKKRGKIITKLGKGRYKVEEDEDRN